MNTWNRIKGAWNVLFPPKQEEIFKRFNITAQGIGCYEKFQSMIDGKAEWNNEHTPSLKLASGISNKITEKTFAEFNCAITAGKVSKPNLDSHGRLVYDKRQRYTYANNDYATFINEQLQGFTERIWSADRTINGLGKILIKCHPEGNKIITSISEPMNYYPVNYNSSGNLTAVLTFNTFRHNDVIYTLYEYSNYDEVRKMHTIEYAGYKQIQHGSPHEVSLSSVKEWQSLKPESHYINIKQPFFIEVSWLDGKPIYYPAIENIKECDKMYGLVLREYKTGAMSVISSPLFFKSDKKGNPIFPEADERNYMVGNLPSDDKKLIDIIAPVLRDEHYLNGINYIERIIETNIGLSHGTISNPAKQEFTATEIEENKQETLVIVGLKQQLWQRTLDRLCKIYDELAMIYKLAKPDKWDLTTTWGDGVKESDKEVFAQLQWMTQAGILHPVYLVAWQRGISQDEAYLMMMDAETAEVETDAYASKIMEEAKQVAVKP